MNTKNQNWVGIKNRWLHHLALTGILAAGVQVRTDAAEDILLLTDTDFCPMADSIQRLYGERVKVVNVAIAGCPKEAPAEARFLLSVVTDPKNAAKVDRSLIDAFLGKGLTVISGLDEYAHHRGVAVVDTPILAQYRELDHKRFPPPFTEKSKYLFICLGWVTNEPAIRIQKMCPWTKGFHVGDEIPWFGLLDPQKKYAAKNSKELYTQEYYTWAWNGPSPAAQAALIDRLWKEWEEKAERLYYQKRLTKLPSDFHGEVIGVSTADQKPALIEEAFDKGRWIAMDLVGPEEPIVHYYYGKGGYSKWVFTGNLCGNTVRHGRFWTRLPTSDEVYQWVQDYAKAHPMWTAIKETEYDYDPEMIEAERKKLGLPEGYIRSHYDLYNLNLGDRTKPIWLVVAGTHGTEWINIFSLLSLAESITDTISQDEPLRRFLEHYCLKLQPLNNPLDYMTCIYRDPWRKNDKEWKMRNVNPESKDYFFFMTHDMHGHPGGGVAVAMLGNGRCVDEAVRRCNEEFKERYLDAPPDNRYGWFTGYGNRVGKMRPRVRTCIFPNLRSRCYGMDSEMPDVRMAYHPSAFLLPATDVGASYIYNEMMPHPWADTRLQSPDPAWEIRLWRYHPDQQKGTMIATFRKADAKKITDWEYLDVIASEGGSPAVAKHQLDGRLHVQGVVCSYPLKEGGLRSNQVWREENAAGPTFLRWHWLQHPDVFRPLVKSHWVLWESAGSKQPAVYLEDRENDGFFETRKGGGDELKGVMIGYYSGHEKSGGWSDLSAAGFSALGTWIQAGGGAIRTVAAGDSLAGLSALIVGNVAETDLTDDSIRKLQSYVKEGGKLVIAMPDLFAIYPQDPSEGQRVWWMTQDTENDWEQQAGLRGWNWDPAPLYKKRMQSYARLCAAFGVLPHPRTVADYTRCHGGWYWFDRYFDRKHGFTDYTGLSLAQPHDRLMAEGFVLESLTEAMQSLLALEKQPFVMGGGFGRGFVLISGTADLFRNRAISEKLHEPVDWNQVELPAPSRNIEVQHRLLQAMLAGNFRLEKVQPDDCGSCQGVQWERTKDGIHISWPGSDNALRHFAMTDYPISCIAAPSPKIGMGTNQAVMQFGPMGEMDRGRMDVEMKFENGLCLIVRNIKDLWNNQTKAVGFFEYKFGFLPGRDWFTFDFRIEPIVVRSPFVIVGSGQSLVPMNTNMAWKVALDEEKQVQIISDGSNAYGIVAKQGRGLSSFRLTNLDPIEFKSCVFCGAGDGQKLVAELAALNMEEPAMNHCRPHPLADACQQAFLALQTSWPRDGREGWTPSAAELERRWRVSEAQEMLRTLRPARAKIILNELQAKEDNRK